MEKTLTEIVAIANDESPAKILASISAKKLETIPNEICKLLTNNGLSFQQAELLLEVAKGRLRRAKL